MYRKFIKPLADGFCALVALIVLLPFIVVTALALFVANKGNVWFIQARPGKHARIFKLIKFKTMTDERDASGNLLADQLRLTKVGSFIRKTSLDELPQLINVLKGDMALVGPRPWLIEYLPLYNAYQMRRHEVKPGITGWAQVNGRNAISWNERFAYDIWYVDHISFALDIKIIFLTIAKVFRSEGISSSTSVTMEKFTGQDDIN